MGFYKKSYLGDQKEIVVESVPKKSKVREVIEKVTEYITKPLKSWSKKKTK